MASTTPRCGKCLIRVGATAVPVQHLTRDFGGWFSQTPGPCWNIGKRWRITHGLTSSLFKNIMQQNWNKNYPLAFSMVHVPHLENITKKQLDWWHPSLEKPLLSWCLYEKTLNKKGTNIAMQTVLILRRKNEKVKYPSRELTYPIPKAVGKMSFLSHWWDMLVPYRVTCCSTFSKTSQALGKFSHGSFGPPKGFHYTRNSWQVTGMYQGISHNKPGRLINQPP